MQQNRKEQIQYGHVPVQFPECGLLCRNGMCRTWMMFHSSTALLFTFAKYDSHSAADNIAATSEFSSTVSKTLTATAADSRQCKSQ